MATTTRSAIAPTRTDQSDDRVPHSECVPSVTPSPLAEYDHPRERLRPGVAIEQSLRSDGDRIARIHPQPIAPFTVAEQLGKIFFAQPSE